LGLLVRDRHRLGLSRSCAPPTGAAPRRRAMAHYADDPAAPNWPDQVVPVSGRPAPDVRRIIARARTARQVGQFLARGGPSGRDEPAGAARRPAPPSAYPSRISSRWGSPPVTSAPSGVRATLTSLRTPKSPGR